MFAEGYSHGVKKKLAKIDKSNTPIRKLKKDYLPSVIDQRDLVGSDVPDLPEYDENKFGQGYKLGMQDAADAANKGGRSRKINKASGGAVHRMPDGTMMAGAKHGMKHGGRIKKCRMDGIALRGKTRAKQRSK